MMQRNKDSLELQEMVSIYGSIQTEPIQNSCGSTHLDTCTCSTCPARKELEQLNTFYMEFLQQEDYSI